MSNCLKISSLVQGGIAYNIVLRKAGLEVLSKRFAVAKANPFLWTKFEVLKTNKVLLL